MYIYSYIHTYISIYSTICNALTGGRRTVDYASQILREVKISELRIYSWGKNIYFALQT